MIDVTAQNEASLELAQQLNGEGIRQADIGDAIRKTVEILSPREEQTATVAVTSGSDSKAEQLRQEVSRELETSGDLQFEAHTASREERKAAQEHGMSTGRYQASRQDGAQQETRPGDLQLPEGSGASPQTPSFQESGPVGGEPAMQPNAAPGGGTP